MATRIIKKYPNRRLYDTETSQYITLDNVMTMVLQHIDFKVIDSKNEEDLTNYVLLQIISEQENENQPIFTTEILKNIIRFYGNSAQALVSQFLEKSTAMLHDQQHLLKQQLEEFMSKDPLNAVTDFTKQNLNYWQNFFRDFYNAPGFKTPNETKKDPGKQDK